MLAMRESHEDWLALGRDLIARGLGAPLLVVADGIVGDRSLSIDALRQELAPALARRWRTREGR